MAAARPSRGRVLELLGRGGECEVLDRLLGGCGRVRAGRWWCVASRVRARRHPERETLAGKLQSPYCPATNVPQPGTRYVRPSRASVCSALTAVLRLTPYSWLSRVMLG